MKITPTSLTVMQLLGAQNEQYVIPAYQRRYSWHEKQLWELIEDVDLLEGSADNHLLGSIVCLTGHHSAGVNALELVDGQQRLTTLNILLQCIMERLSSEGQTDEAQEIERMLRSKAPNASPVAKIALDSLDAEDLRQHASGAVPERVDNPSLAEAFAFFRNWAREKPASELVDFVYRLKNQVLVIRLDVSDAKDAFKLFETINNRGLRLSSADIIKNFVLGNAARFGSESLELARKRWGELIRNLDGTNFEAFFRHYLCAHFRRRVTKAFVVTYFKSVFMGLVKEAEVLPERHFYSDDDTVDDDAGESAESDGETPTEVSVKAERIPFAAFLGHIVKCSKAFGELVHANTGVTTIDRHLRNLKLIKSQQTYGFLMALRVGECPTDAFVEILRLTEALLMRRHICRERSNDNERAFARLCGVDCANPVPEVTAKYRELSPTDDEFQHAFRHFEFVPNLIDRARYCLEQFELHAQGRYPELVIGGSDMVHVEHIIPIKIKTKGAKEEFGDWPKYLGPNSETMHPDFVSLIGNLTLFAGTLNISASNNPYARKKAAYEQSALKLTQALPHEFPEFRFGDVELRCERFSQLAVKLWPIP